MIDIIFLFFPLEIVVAISVLIIFLERETFKKK